MIPKPDIAKWRAHAPWTSFDQVEQDLVISRALIANFSDEFLNDRLAFRGGTALHKLYLNPAPRYSEDIDLVQMKPGPIKPIMQKIGEVIDFFDEDRKTALRGHGPKMYYRFSSEYERVRLRLKIEINSKEHFNVFDLFEFPFKVDSAWFTGEANIKTYSINELLGTKLRALYQRKKGRDLFDLDYSRLNTSVNLDEVIESFKAYMKFSTGHIPTRREFELTLLEKEQDPDFRGDMEALLRPGIAYNEEAAFEWMRQELLTKLK